MKPQVYGPYSQSLPYPTDRENCCVTVFTGRVRYEGSHDRGLEASGGGTHPITGTDG